MLVIRRRVGESVTIDGGIQIEVLEAGPGRVRLGIHAPTTISIVRSEVELTRRQNLLAAHSSGTEVLDVLRQQRAEKFRTDPQQTPESSDM